MTAHSLLLVILMFAPSAKIHWTQHTPMPQPRAGYAAGVLSSRMIVAGGSFWMGETKQRTKAVDAFDPHCNCWSSLPPLPVALSDAAGVTVANTFYLLGGTDGKQGLRDVYVFDGSTWLRRDDLQLPEARLYGAAITDGHRIYVMAGISVLDDYASGIRTVWSIDPSHPKGGWQRLPDCDCDPRANAGAVAFSGSLWLIGGLRATTGDQQNLSDIRSFDLKTQRWKLAGSLPHGRRALWAGLAGDRILLFGGYTDRFCSDILTIRDGDVSYIGDLPEPVAAAAFLQIGAQWYTAGGEIGQHVRGKITWSGSIPIKP
jgi:N-acetylneuraminic acid mutarotase